MKGKWATTRLMLMYIQYVGVVDFCFAMKNHRAIVHQCLLDLTRLSNP